MRGVSALALCNQTFTVKSLAAREQGTIAEQCAASLARCRIPVQLASYAQFKLLLTFYSIIVDVLHSDSLYIYVTQQAQVHGYLYA